MRRLLLPSLSFLLICCCSPTTARSTGALKRSCRDMTPAHGTTTSRTSASPYRVSVSQTKYKPGEQIEVTLRAVGCAEPFKGFLLEARAADPALDTSELLGEFEPVPGTHTLCRKADDINGGLTHSTPEARRDLKVIWKAPIRSAGHVVFKATFVQSYAIYWTAVTSAVLYDPTAPPLSVPEGSIVTPILSCAKTRPPSLSTNMLSGKSSSGSLQPSTNSASGPSGSPSDSASKIPSMVPWRTPFMSVAGPTATPPPWSQPTPPSTPPLSTDYLYSTPFLPSSQQTSVRSSFSVSRKKDIAITHKKPLLREEGCQTTLGCFDDCVTGCTFTVSWRKKGDNMYFRLRSISGGNSWMAIGLSNDALMGNDSVTECVSFRNSVQVYQSFNTQYANERLANPESGFSDPKGSFNNGVYECSFLRQIKATGDDKIFSLDEPWHVMFAYGTALPGYWKMPHTPQDRWVTEKKLNLYTVDKPTTTTVSPPQSKIVHGSACGKTQGCFDDCATGCTFSVTWVEESSNIRFRLKSYQDDSSWMAVGFSDDKLMGDDTVSECVIHGGKVQVFESHNVGYTNKRDVHPKAGVSDVSGGIQDGVFECSFLREVRAHEDSESLNLTRKWYLLYAQGRANSDFSIQPHNVKPMVTSAVVDFTRHVSLGGSTTTHPLVLAHGSLMCLAWLLFASVGLVLARYFKPLWPDSTLGGVKIWFQVHRICMTFTFLFNAAAFVIIFIQSRGYSQILGETYQKSHPILGIIVTALVIINPIMAYFRPGPKSEKRTVFNWAHFLVGTGAYILAVITIFFGMELSKANAPSYMKFVLVGYVAWQLLVDVTLEIIECRTKPKDSPSHDVIQMQNPSQIDKVAHQPTPSNVHFGKPKQMILCVHICVVTGVTAAVTYVLVAL